MRKDVELEAIRRIAEVELPLIRRGFEEDNPLFIMLAANVMRAMAELFEGYAQHQIQRRYGQTFHMAIIRSDEENRAYSGPCVAEGQMNSALADAYDVAVHEVNAVVYEFERKTPDSLIAEFATEAEKQERFGKQ